MIMTPASPPAEIRKGLTKDQATCYDWLAANDIVEWLPENSTIQVRGRQIVYDSFVWNDGMERGFNSRFAATCDPGLSPRIQDIIAQNGTSPNGAIIEQRAMPLLAPLTDDIRAAFARSGVRLSEQ